MPIFLPIALVQGASPPAGVTENVVDFAASTGVDMFGAFSTLPANAPAFTLAMKATVQALAGSGQGYLAATSINEYFRIDQSLGRLQLRIRDTAGTVLFSETGTILDPHLAADDEIAVVMAADQSQIKLVAGIKRAGSSTVTQSTLVNSTHTTANNLVLLRYLNTRNASAANSVNMHYHGVWHADAYIDPVANFSSFFDANNVLTEAMFNGDAIQGVARDFGETGNAAAWSAKTVVGGEITDVPFDGGGSDPLPNPDPTFAAFGALTPIGTAPISVSAADGTYGEFTVASGQAVANTSPLTPGDVQIGTTDISVVADSVSVATQGELQNVVSGTVASGASTCYLNPGTYDSDSLDFEGQRGSITYRSAANDNVAQLNRWRFLGTTNLPSGQAPTFRNLLFTKPHFGPDDYFFGMFNSAAADGPMFIFISGSCTLDGLSFYDCVIDGQLEPIQNGGRAEIVDGFIVLGDSPGVTNLTIDRCEFRKQQTSLKIGLDGQTIRHSTFDDIQGDALALRPGTDNTLFEWNYYDPSGADNSGFHGDFTQVQVSNETTPVQNVTWRFNISYAKRVMWGQGNVTGPTTPVFISTSTTINTANHNGRELRLSGLSGPITLTLPDPTTVTGQQFCFRNVDATPGDISFALGGATWVDGTPAFTQTNQGLTFVSDGTGVWKRLPRGYSQEWYQRTSSFTLGVAEETWLTYLNAQTNAVTATLPAEAGQTFIINCENNDNVARVVPNTGDTITYNGSTVTEVVYWPGLSCTWEGDSAGNWNVTEQTGAAQMIFANQAKDSVIQGWDIYGNIFCMQSPKGIQFENNAGNKPALNMNFYNNTFLYGIFPDQNGDAQRTEAEGNTGVAVGSIWINSPSIRSWNNIIVGNLNFDGTGGDDLNSSALGLTGDKSTIPAALSDRFNITSVDDLYPVNDTELLAIATPKAAGLEDGTFRGATALADFVAETEVTNTPAPTLTFSVPGDGDTYGTDGDIVLTFDQFMEAGTGVITLRDVTGSPTVVESFNPVTGSGDNGGTISVDLTRVTITPGAALTNSNNYALQGASGSLVGHYGDDWAGISDDTTLNFTADAAVPTSFTSTSVALGDNWQKTGGFTGAPSSTTKMLFGFKGTPVLQSPGSSNERLTTFFAEDGSSDFGIELFESDNTIRIIWGSRSYEVSGGVKFGQNTEILLSIDTAAATRDAGIICYVDGVRQVIGGSDWNQNATINPSSINTQYVLRSAVTGRDYAGSIDMLYVGFPATLPDLDSASNRSLFLPYKIGANGNGPTGASPAFYQTGALADWQDGNQLGAGGGGYATAGNFTP